jgi:hypothetical protein
MNTPQQQGEPERQKGLGGRVRRFVDSELSRDLDRDRDDPEADRGRAGYQAPEYDRPAEPTTSYADTPDSPAHPVTTAPADPGSDTPRHGRSTEEAAADSSAERVGLLNDPVALRAQWQQVQGTFVDDPHRAVQEASVLVNRTLEEIRENITRGQISEPASTEDLRMSFQRYREFFQRLLSA